MNKLIKIEMERAFKNKMLIISVVIGLVIVGFNIWNEIIPARKTLDRKIQRYTASGTIYEVDGSKTGVLCISLLLYYAAADSIAIFYKYIDGCEEALC